MISGLSLSAVGMALSLSGINKPYKPIYDRQAKVGNVVLVIAAATCITGYVFYRAAKKNKKKAMNMTFKYQPLPQVYKRSFVYKPIPSINLKISL